MERELAASGARVVVGIDEVGRGALAGPVCVGAAAWTPECGPAPQGLRDSKKLTPAKRERLEPLVQQWAASYAVGSASNAEIDDVGLSECLRRAALRALGALTVTPDAVLLDGKHNWLAGLVPCPMRTIIKGDDACVSIAAASIVAKVSRDATMADLSKDHPEYGWESNMGYASAPHRVALSVHGPTSWHRTSWRLPTTMREEETLPL